MQMTLDKCKKSRKYRILSILGSDDVQQRFAIFGFSVGSVIEIQNISLFRLVIKVMLHSKAGGASFLIRSKDAKQLIVENIP